MLKYYFSVLKKPQYINYKGKNKLFNEEEKNNLIKDYEPLIISIINKKKFYIEGAEFQDVIQEGRVALFKALNTFDESKDINFSVYAKKVIENHLINVMKKSTNSKNMPLNNAYNINNQGELNLNDSNARSSQPVPIKSVRSTEEFYMQEESAKLLIDSIVKNLSPLENQILQLKLQELTYTEIAEKLNLTSKVVDNALNRIKNKILNLKG